MTTTDPLARFGTKQTPQNQQVPGRVDQVENNAGGFVFQIDPLSQLRRFLTIGTAGGTYYVGENELTAENGNLVIELTKNLESHKALVDTIVEISLAGRAPKQNPTLFALAIACQMGETEGKQYARKQINSVVRTGTHLFIFVKYLQQFGGWSRGLRKAVGNWYAEKDTDKLAYQLVKYRQREGYTHRDVLRLSHPTVHASKRSTIEWAVKGELKAELPSSIVGYTHVNAPGADIPALLDMYKGLPWEALPDSAMNDAKVWDKLLDNGMPITALVRQLPRLTKLGMVPDMGGRTDDVIAQLLNPEMVERSRIHPINVLVAMKTYRSGRGMRSEWTPTAKIIDALDEMFYLSFGNVTPTGKRTMNALDISGSMAGHWGYGRTSIPGAKEFPLSPREISAAMSMVAVRTEPNIMTVGFSHDLVGLPISKRQRLDDVINTVSALPFGATDCSLPMLKALHEDLEIDTFVVYTDSETWYGKIHPFQALQQYRKTSGIDAKLVVVAATPTKFSIADPRDPGMLDVSGFDSAVPQLISDFSAGLI
jgi:60 kDa SS-A/Ro ribonucleoprotein